MITLMTQVELAIAHRLPKHGGKCRRLHGHNYVLKIEVSGLMSSSTGMIADFSVLKNLVHSAIEDRYDHKTILNRWDTKYVKLPAADVVRINVQPTAEELVRIFAEEMREVLTPLDLAIVSLELSETSGCSARYMV